MHHKNRPEPDLVLGSRDDLWGAGNPDRDDGQVGAVVAVDQGHHAPERRLPAVRRLPFALPQPLLAAQDGAAGQEGDEQRPDERDGCVKSKGRQQHGSLGRTELEDEAHQEQVCYEEPQQEGQIGSNSWWRHGGGGSRQWSTFVGVRRGMVGCGATSTIKGYLCRHYCLIRNDDGDMYDMSEPKEIFSIVSVPGARSNLLAWRRCG
ncbi:hypothetical protein BX600DRAFT_521420 [Xylariales sp. PMI_506]|nr:hypothetical protein BX600DRAFT_521420 [Xylariales sp. PMI_506]